MADHVGMAAEASRRALLALGAVALVAVAATGLVVASRGGAEPVQGRDRGVGERLEARLLVRVDDDPVAEATATLTITNPTRRAAWYRGNPCSGPGVPVLRPAGAGAAAQAGSAGGQDLRADLIASGEEGRTIPLRSDTEEVCTPEVGPVEVAPGASVRLVYDTAGLTVDRSAPVQVTARVVEVTRTNRAIGRVRLAVPFEAHADAVGTTVDQAVDAFLADPEVAGFIAAGDGDFLTQVHREDDGWRFGLSGDAGQLSAEVRAGTLAVTDVQLGTAP